MLRLCTFVMIMFMSSTALAEWKNNPEIYRDVPVRYWIGTHQTAARMGVLGANMLIGCLKGGIGSDQYSFWQGCWRGAIGGLVAFSGEYVASHVDKALIMGGAGKLIHSLGVSMQDNVAEDIGVFSRYQLDVGPTTFTIGGPDRFRISYTVHSFIGIGRAFGVGGKFNLKASVLTLTPIFDYKGQEAFAGGLVAGFCQGTVVAVNTGLSRHIPPGEILSHELNHSISHANFRLAGNIFRIEGLEVGRFALRSLHDTLAAFPETYYWTPMEMQAYSMEQ